MKCSDPGPAGAVATGEKYYESSLHQTVKALCASFKLALLRKHYRPPGASLERLYHSDSMAAEFTASLSQGQGVAFGTAWRLRALLSGCGGCVAKAKACPQDSTLLESLGPLAQFEFLDLAAGRARQVGDDFESLRPVGAGGAGLV